MTDKEKLEMLNLRNRVSNQRETIKQLSEEVERLRLLNQELCDLIDAHYHKVMARAKV